jgi:hypothetical protein
MNNVANTPSPQLQGFTELCSIGEEIESEKKKNVEALKNIEEEKEKSKQKYRRRKNLDKLV